MAIAATFGRVAVSKRIHISLKAQAFAAFLFAAALGAKVWVRMEMTDLGYNLAEARKVTIQLDMKRREAELKLSILHRRDHLLKMANEKLGLELPTASQVVEILE